MASNTNSTLALNSFTPQGPANFNALTNQLQIEGSSYDGAGNQTAIGGYGFTYDAENRMTSSEINSITTNYVYDGNGHRVMKSTGAAATTYVYDAMGQLIAEYGNPSAPDSGTKYVSVDHLGSTRLVTDTSQNQEACYDYLPFGEQIASGTDGRTAPCFTTTATPLTQKFTGKERDVETNNDFFESRYFSAAQERFVSPDHAGMFAVSLANPQTLNRYAYVLNNSLSLTDPHGYDCVYLNDDRNGVGSIDNQIGSTDCGKNGGYWVDGTVTQAQITNDQGNVSVGLTGTTNGADTTNASYTDTALLVELVSNTPFNPFGHIALGLSGTVPVGLNPASDARFNLSLIGNFAMSCLANQNCESAPIDALARTKVPGAILPQVGGTTKDFTWIPVTGMQATMIQSAINESKQLPPPYSVLGNSPACDCGTWAQQVMSAGGLNSGPPAPIPEQLMKQLIGIYDGR